MKAISEYIKTVNDEMSRRFCTGLLEPKELYDPVSYILGNGGKRIRAVMVLVAADMFEGVLADAIGPALGVEMFHNFTLLHDDIMDKAPMRRGVPTVHVKWDENTSILSGDAMMILANQLIVQTKPSILTSVLDTFNKTALQVCEGQQLDMNLEKRNLKDSSIAEAEYMEMIRLKTSVLIGASLKIGALCGGSNTKDAALLYEYGLNIGLAFQVQDDLLDTFGVEADFGKRIGGDIIEGKKTFLLVKLMELASDDDKRIVIEILDNEKNETVKVKTIKDLYLKYEINKIAHQTIEHLFANAKKHLVAISVDPHQRHSLEELDTLLIKRVK